MDQGTVHVAKDVRERCSDVPSWIGNDRRETRSDLFNQHIQRLCTQQILKITNQYPVPRIIKAALALLKMIPRLYAAYHYFRSSHLSSAIGRMPNRLQLSYRSTRITVELFWRKRYRTPPISPLPDLRCFRYLTREGSQNSQDGFPDFNLELFSYYSKDAETFLSRKRPLVKCFSFQLSFK